jgi:arsenate reductase-like glutaredoxin family protein
MHGRLAAMSESIMGKKIDWMYDRKACMTCKRARGYLDSAACSVQQVENAAKIKYGPAAALKLLHGVDRIVAMKGKKIVAFDLKKDRPDDETLLAHLIGPTGNLRAPTVRVGKTLLVGFNEETYKEVVGL